MVDSPGFRVFVGGISWKADEVQLENFFSHHGHVLECKIIMDRTTGKSKGYGFVTFQDADAAERVKQTANFHFLGKNMNVGDAVRKTPEPNSSNNTNTGRSHSNYNHSGKNYQYYNQNYYGRPDDIQYYGHYSPDGMFYPPQYYYPQGYQGNVQQYQYGIQQGGFNNGQYPPYQPDDNPTATLDNTDLPATGPYPPGYGSYSPNVNPNPNPNPNFNGNFYNFQNTYNSNNFHIYGGNGGGGGHHPGGGAAGYHNGGFNNYHNGTSHPGDENGYEYSEGVSSTSSLHAITSDSSKLNSVNITSLTDSPTSDHVNTTTTSSASTPSPDVITTNPATNTSPTNINTTNSFNSTKNDELTDGLVPTLQSLHLHQTQKRNDLEQKSQEQAPLSASGDQPRQDTSPQKQSNYSSPRNNRANFGSNPKQGLRGSSPKPQPQKARYDPQQPPKKFRPPTEQPASKTGNQRA